ncbi:MAG: VOC family protein [Solirubrobacterales bacterium]
MSERNGFEHGVPCWVDTWQDDADAAARFYSGIFGWEIEDTRPPGSGERYLICRVRDRDVAAIGSPIPEGAPPTAVWTTYVRVDEADDAATRAEEAGGRLVIEPFDSLDGGRMSVLADPEGAVLVAWTPGEHSGAQLVDEPGAWSMSALNTRDPEPAKRFYGAVFGWETEAFDAGGGEAELFRLPGFVGGEPTQPVPRDVVAVMVEMDSHGMPKELPPHWSVDFWIDDTDAAVAKVGDLGGKVAMEPVDAPPFRRAAIVDPGGAAMTISQLKLG